MAVPKATTVNIAEAKRRLSELVGRVAFGGDRVLITRRGRPMAKLVPPDSPEALAHLADVAGWLPDDDPFFHAVDDVVAARVRHIPRASSRRTRGRGVRRP